MSEKSIQKKVTIQGNVIFLFVIGLALLKIFGIIDISWFWVILPIIIPFIFMGTIIFFMIVILILDAIIRKK